MTTWSRFSSRVFAVMAFAVLGTFVATPAIFAAPAIWLSTPIGAIGPASEDVLETILDKANATGGAEVYAGVIIRLDTPGGALESTRSMVKKILGASLPIIVWVGPSGSRAGSAGTFLTMAAHVAAMAPSTNIGAAHPIQADGKDISDDELGRKITNDAIAFIESIAETKGRNVDMAKSFVARSISITEREALDNKVIDLIAGSEQELLKALDGRKVTLASGKVVTLATQDAKVEAFEPSPRQKLLEILSNPNLFYLLFLAGLIGIGYELTHPGIVFPGVFGGICLILALTATSVLPVSAAAAALILVGIAFMIGEAFVPSFGALGIGGLVALVLGSVFLVDPNNTSGLRVSWYVIAPGVVVAGAAFVVLGYLILRARRAPEHSGANNLVGTVGIVLADFDGDFGQIRVEGDIWKAKAAAPLKKGDRVTVSAVDGLTLTVEAQPRPNDIVH